MPGLKIGRLPSAPTPTCQENVPNPTRCDNAPTTSDNGDIVLNFEVKEEFRISEPACHSQDTKAILQEAPRESCEKTQQESQQEFVSRLKPRRSLELPPLPEGEPPTLEKHLQELHPTGMNGVAPPTPIARAEQLARDLRPVAPPASVVAAAPVILSTPDGGSDSMQSPSKGLRTAADSHDQKQFSHLPPLPDGWIRVRSRTTGAIYYHNTNTNESTFTDPTVLQTYPATELPPGWIEAQSRSSGRTYYWNAVSKESQFERPLLSAFECMQREESPAGDDTELPAGWVEMTSKTTGRPYYWNTVSQETQFERPLRSAFDCLQETRLVLPSRRESDCTPREIRMGEDNEGLPEGWISVISRTTGRTYYYNAETQTSQFNRPEG
jgi:hypothetical protein